MTILKCQHEDCAEDGRPSGAEPFATASGLEPRVLRRLTGSDDRPYHEWHEAQWVVFTAAVKFVMGVGSLGLYRVGALLNHAPERQVRMTPRQVVEDMRATAQAHDRWAMSNEVSAEEAATSAAFASQLKDWMTALEAALSEAAVDPHLPARGTDAGPRATSAEALSSPASASVRREDEC